MKILFKKKLLWLFVLFLLNITSNTAYCNDRAELLKIEGYLNSLKYIVAKFVQVDSDKNIQRGNFFLSRPGKLKWEYQTPKKITILFKGNRIYYHDKDLNQKSNYKTQDSLIYFLMSPKIDFLTPSSEYYLQSFGKTKKWITLQIKKRNQLKDEVLLLRFNAIPLKLISVGIKGSLQIFIDSIVEYKSLDKNLFRT
jgi:outer membrane lipoprotein-sorting protein